MTTISIHEKACKQGLILPSRTSAKQLRKTNPELAGKWAAFIDQNKKELIALISGAILK